MVGKYKEKTPQEYNKLYYEKNKLKILLKFTCSVCGRRYSSSNYHNHCLTNKHLKAHQKKLEEEIEAMDIDCPMEF